MGGGADRRVGHFGGTRHVPLGHGGASRQGSLLGAGVVKQEGVDEGTHGSSLQVMTGQGATVGQNCLEVAIPLTSSLLDAAPPARHP